MSEFHLCVASHMTADDSCCIVENSRQTLQLIKNMSRVDLKIVLLGSEYVGKTSLLERYAHDRFSENFAYQNTIGAAFAAKQVQAHNKKFVIGIWDTAGSERYESMSRIYYRGAKAAIVCYDIGNIASWDRAKFWVNELRSLEENCRIYLCGTKKDVPEGRQVEINIASRYADGIQATYYETSSKTGENVVQLFQTIAEDFISCPDNVRQVEETITLSAKEKKSSCCSGRNGAV